MDNSVDSAAHAVTATDEAAIARQVKRAGSSFYWAMRLMPAKRRAALFAIYAFCREVDDIADGDLPLSEKRAALKDWHTRIADLYEGRAPNDTVLDRALLSAIADYDLKRTDFEAVIRGMEMDADGPIRAPDLETLLFYCDCVASAVGRLCVRVFGAEDTQGIALSDHLGKALQLTNIIRDVEEDARLGRLYLPAELLQKADINSRDPAIVAADPRLSSAKKELAKRAECEFQQAREILVASRQGDLRPARIMMEVYARIFYRLRKRGYAPQSQSGMGRIFEKMEKLAIALRYAVGGPQ